MTFRLTSLAIGAALACLSAGTALGADQPATEKPGVQKPAAQETAAKEPAYGPQLEGFDYPYPVQHFDFESERQTLQMAYIDVQPAHGNGQTAVLLHGKNFCAGTWGATIKDLAAAGYRVIAPDQIGFCKSSKPDAYQFTFRALSRNTHALLEHLHIVTPIVIGHSTGGMLAAHYALLYPKDLRQLVLVNPVGLEDWAAKGVGPISIDEWYASELKTNADRIRNYEKSTYYVGQWKPEYEQWVQMLAGLNRGPGKKAVAWDSALIYDMIMTEPVLYRFPDIKVPTLLMIGQKDTTAIGKAFASPAVRPTLGHYPVLGREAAKAIPGAKLVEFPDLGHAPQMSEPERFDKALIAGMAHP